MKTLFLSPDYRCNERCIFCPCAENARQYHPLSLEEMRESLDMAMKNPCVEMVLLSGGEPTLRKETLSFIKYVRTKNIKWGILSNSLKFASKTFLNEFIDVTGTSFELTTAFHSYDPKQHNMITQVPDSFEKSLQGVMNLIEVGINVTIKYVINKMTFSELPEYATWIYNTFSDNIPWVICNIDVCGIALKNRNKTAIPFSESKPFVEKALDKVIEFSRQGRMRNVNIFNTPLCCIDPYYWPFLKKGEGGIISALRLPYEKKEDNYLKVNLMGDGGAIFASCSQCVLQGKCPGTWSNTGELYENDLKPFKQDE